LTATDREIVIIDGARTPMGGFQGDLKDVAAPALGAAAISASLERSGVEVNDISEVIMGCVLPAGLKQGPARQAAFGAGLPADAGCTTVNKLCGSGMKTVMMGYEALHVRPDDVIVAGGMESMSNAPYLLLKARSGQRLGHGQMLDHMFYDGLEDAYDEGKLMGHFAEDTATHYQFTREAQDAYAIESLNRARTASEDGSFDKEITPVTVKTRKGETVVSRDEQPFNANIEKIPHLKPAFVKDGTVTPANSSSISDGAAALVMMSGDQAKARGLAPRARIIGCATHSQEPKWFTTAPITAIAKLLENVGWDKTQVDLYEVNEAFAVVAMAAMRDLELDHTRVNIHGGACALGHPVGASGTRIMLTLLAAMEKHDLKKGVASLCIGGGEATAIALERA
jgi:acetyl-CoA C-acetyltransferase